MADNTDNAITPLGRFNLIDPNSFGNQTNTGSVFNKELGEDMFSENNYNISVPLEDLCISVELETEAKTRTILTTNNGNSVINTKGNNVTVKFIGGTNEKKSTDNANENINLTTSYTDMFSQNEPIEEALGITSIDIDFNSSYTPMVNINFIDVKGAAIFQSQGNSKYSVFFSLPYPLFRLKIKGYYGKPVVYCLHLIKFNSKFNSQTGNFEIATQFIGYTYAMLSDMIMGLVKPASLTTRGQELLKARGVIDIPTFEKRVGEVNELIKKEVLTANDTDVMALNKTQELINKLKTEVLTLIDGTISKFTTNFDSYIINKNKDDINVNLGDPNLAIVILNCKNNIIVNNLTTKKIYDEFIVDLYKIKSEFNNNLGDYKSDQKISLENTCYTFDVLINVTGFTSSDNTFIKDKFKNNALSLVKYGNGLYNEQDIDNNINEYLAPYKNALDGNASTTLVDSYNFTRIIKEVNESIKQLEKIQETTKTNIAIKLNEKLKTELGFDMTIRNIFNLLTTNVEVFLQQLLEVSKKSQNNPIRTKELSNKFKNNTTGTGIDVPKKYIEKDTFLPWPEYYENREEKYLATALDNPSNVDEIKFVEELFIIQQTKLKQIEDSAKNLLEDNSIINQAFTPLDSNYYNKGEKNPYDRLDDSANGNDIATLILLRAIGLLGFGNNGNYITDDEIKSFAQNDARLLIDKFSINQNIIGYLTTNYNEAIKYLEQTDKPFTVGDSQKILNKSNDKYNYDYIKQNSAWNGKYPAALPITFPFNKVEGDIDDYLRTNTNSKGKPIYRLSNIKNNEQKGTPTQNINFIEIIDRNTYNNGGKSSPAINFDGLSTSPFSAEKAKFQIGSGRFGAQDFTSIIYPNSNNQSSDFYTVFYNDELADALTNISRNIFYTYGSLSDKKLSGETLDINYNISNTKSVFYNNTVLNRENFFVDLKSRPKISKNRFLLSSNEQLSYPFVNFTYSTQVYSLFGSRFYNAQQTNEARAFLFLHCLPWNGLYSNKKNGESLFNNNYIQNVFNIYTGFIQVPYLYSAFIGGLLYRYEQNNDIILFSANNQSLFKSSEKQPLIKPKKDEYLHYHSGQQAPLSLLIDINLASAEYTKIDSIILNLPRQVKDVFIQEFKNFVKEFGDNRLKFEVNTKVLPNNDNEWKKTYNEILTGTTTDGVPVYIKNKSSVGYEYNKNFKTSKDGTISIPFNKFDGYLNLPKNSNNENDIKQLNKFYIIFPKETSSDSYQTFSNYNYFIEYSDESEASKQIVTWMKDYKYIINNSWMIWDKNISDYETVSIDETKLKIYLTEIITGIAAKNKELTTYKFSNTNFQDLKFEMYRTLKKINDKWISLSENDSTELFFQCCKGKEKRLPKDTQLAEHRTGKKGETPKLIDSFRFVDRAFHDIGDELAINPFMVVKLLLDNSGNTSLADLISRILSDNNMEFIALPNFINYNETKELMTVFKPYPYYEANELTETGPSFVCVYIGQTSTKLDFSDNQNFEFDNDGFDFTKDGTRMPSDFTETPELWEDVGAAFLVNYGHQNQNIFKDVRLDQAEFSETIESLSITDQLVNNPNNIYAGQNLYNIYSVRSYKAEVEMLGDAMIQPMMYFQLNNIPMFHGAYLVTKVKHSIVPNHMTTTFTGTRVKVNKTPLVDVTKLFKDILNNYNLPNSTTNQPLGKVIDYVKDIKLFINILSVNKPNPKTITGTTLQTKDLENYFNIEYNKFNKFITPDDEKEKQGIINKDYLSFVHALPNEPWCASFASYLMTKIDKSFPKTALSAEIAANGLKGLSGYESFLLSDSELNIKAEIGDLIIYTDNATTSEISHVNLVYNTDNDKKAYVGGGNISNTIKKGEMILKGGYYDKDNLKVGKFGDMNPVIIVKKTGGIYYKKDLLPFNYGVSTTSVNNNINKIKRSKLYNDVAFRDRLKKLCDKWKISEDDILSIFNAECEMNPADSLYKTTTKFVKTYEPNSILVATGLIQWTSDNVKKGGTPGPNYTLESIQKMSGVEQLELVDMYFEFWKKANKDITNGSKLGIYSLVFFPAYFTIFLNGSDTTIIQSNNLSAETISKQNPIIATTNKKTLGDALTVGDFKRYVNSI